MTEFERLREVIARLRAEDGCPWDREQTHVSLKPACIEEAAEVIGGINILEATGDPDNLIEELGDLLLQVVMPSDGISISIRLHGFPTDSMVMRL